MKLLLTLLIMGTVLALGLFAAAPGVSAAVNPLGPACEGITDASVCQAGNNDPISGENGVLLKAVDIVAYISGFAAVLMLVVAGLKFVTSSGDPNSVKSARDTVLYALIGVAVLILSQTLVKFIISKI